MKDKKYIFLTTAILWIVVFGCFFILLKKNQYGFLDSDDKHLIGASYMTMNNEFYEIMSEEISQRVEAEGDQLVLRDPALSVERQIEQINEMLDMGIDVLVLTPVDWEGLTDTMEKAKKNGVYIVVVDSNVKDESWEDFYRLCQNVTKDTDQDGTIDQFGVAGYSWEDAFYENGVSLFDAEGTVCNLNSDNVEEAIRFIEQLNDLTKGYDVTAKDFDNRCMEDFFINFDMEKKC